jgi:uncharacterized protein (DUF433 family)
MASVNTTSAILRDPEIMSGTPCFRGTRVPLQNLFDYLEGGETLDRFLHGFPSVSREQALQGLEEAKELLMEGAAKGETRAVTCNPEILSGAPAFRGTRVFLRSLFDYLEHGDPLTEFFEDFPSVSPGLVHEVLQDAQRLLIAKL